MGERDDEYNFGNAKQRVGGTGPFKERELAKLLALKGKKESEIRKNLMRKFQARDTLEGR